MTEVTQESIEQRRDHLQPLDDVLALCERARKEVSRLCQRSSHWTMCVPPQHDDSDMLFVELIAQTRHLIAEVARLREALELATTAEGQAAVMEAQRQKIHALKSDLFHARQNATYWKGNALDLHGVVYDLADEYVLVETHIASDGWVGGKPA